jgi:ribosome-associated protein
MATSKSASSPKAGSKAASPKAKPVKKAAVVAIDPEESFARLCAEGALDKKAEDVVILDMRGISSFTDFFVIASGTSEPQLKAIAGSIREKVREATGQRPTAEDGFPASQWVIIDYGSVIVHIFHTEKRGLYGLEDLWNDAKRIEVEG